MRYFIIFIFLLLLSPTEVGATSFIANGFRLNKKVKPLKETKRENVVTQSLDYSCGAAGLSTLFQYYLNDPIDEKEIIGSLLQLVPMAKVQARKGFSLFDLKKFAEAKGYEVTGYKMDMAFLKDLRRPVLVPIKFKNYRHFVIVKGVIDDRVFIADPAVGNMSMKTHKFEDIWTNGIGLVVEKAGDQDHGDYALSLDESDLVIADYRKLKGLIDKSLIRTAVFPTEY